MSFFKPRLFWHNTLVVDENENMKSVLPFIAPSRLRRLKSLVFAPTLTYHKTLNSASPLDSHAGITLGSTFYCENNFGQLFAIQLVRDSMHETQTTPKPSEGFSVEPEEIKQFETLDQAEIDEKWDMTRERLAKAKASFQESYKTLEKELILAKAQA